MYPSGGGKLKPSFFAVQTFMPGQLNVSAAGFGCFWEKILSIFPPDRRRFPHME